MMPQSFFAFEAIYEQIQRGTLFITPCATLKHRLIQLETNKKQTLEIELGISIATMVFI